MALHSKVFIFLLAVFLLGCASPQNAEPLPKVCFENGKCVTVEFAVTDEEKIQGLMFRESLAENTGMLFPYKEEATLSVWMKNMNFAIDIIWIDKQHRIVDIRENVQPCTIANCPVYTGIVQAKYFLEVPAGFVKENSLAPLQKVKFANVPY